MKNKKLLSLLLAVVFVYMGGRYVYYGSFVRSCVYTENRLPVPEQLASGKIVVAKDAYLYVGNEKIYSCLKNFSNIDIGINNANAIENWAGVKDYHINRGLTLEKLNIGTTFSVVDVVAITKHGITTIDSGHGPLYYLILKDQNDILYKITTESFGINDKDTFLAFIDEHSVLDESVMKLLSPRSFSVTRGRKEENSLVYTGKLVEL